MTFHDNRILLQVIIEHPSVWFSIFPLFITKITVADVCKRRSKHGCAVSPPGLLWHDSPLPAYVSTRREESSSTATSVLSPCNYYFTLLALTRVYILLSRNDNDDGVQYASGLLFFLFFYPPTTIISVVRDYYYLYCSLSANRGKTKDPVAAADGPRGGPNAYARNF